MLKGGFLLLVGLGNAEFVTFSACGSLEKSLYFTLRPREALASEVQERFQIPVLAPKKEKT